MIQIFTLISETLAHEIFIQRFSRNILAHFNNSLSPPDVDHRCPILSKEADI